MIKAKCFCANDSFEVRVRKSDCKIFLICKRCKAERRVTTPGISRQYSVSLEFLNLALNADGTFYYGVS